MRVGSLSSSVRPSISGKGSFQSTRVDRPPEVALLLSSYQKPWHLKRVLASIAMQERALHCMELIVTDDGSTDETADIVVRFAQSVSFPVRFTTHEHQEFQLARCRNEGVAASTAPYLLFLDGDCLLPPDHVWQHLQHRKRGEVMGGYCVRLDQQTSERIDEQAVRSQAYLKWVSRKDLRKLAVRDWKSRFYRAFRHPQKPKLAGGNIGIWRADYERVNGYDENFQGWGGEDDDLRRRLVKTGVRIGSILRWTRTYHLWHPVEPSVPKKASLGDNYQYLSRRGALSKCRQGLKKRLPKSIGIGTSPNSLMTEQAKSILVQHGISLSAATTSKKNLDPLEIEIAFHPGTTQFSQNAECRVLVVLDQAANLPHKLQKEADLVLSDIVLKQNSNQPVFPLADFNSVLNSIG